MLFCNLNVSFFLLQKKTHINKRQASITDIWDRINGTNPFRQNLPCLFRDQVFTLWALIGGKMRKRRQRQTHTDALFSLLFQWLLFQPWCQFWVYFKEHYWEQNRRPSILMIWTRKIAFSVQINYPNHRVFCIHFNEITIYFIESCAFLLQIRHIYMINTWNLKGWLN